METPKNWAGRLTETIMLSIREHIKPGGLNPGEVAHYNRAYEEVYRILEGHDPTAQAKASYVGDGKSSRVISPAEDEVLNKLFGR